MSFLTELKQYKSVSIVGMAKNTGKTTCLNYVLSELAKTCYPVAVTSIGVDGEERDVLYDTLKPRITLYKDNYFITSEQHYKQKKINSTIIAIDEQATALGRLITAKAEDKGQVILSGPSSTNQLLKNIYKLQEYGNKLVIVDGALSRLSLASPAITDAMILCTGAACSRHLDTLIKKIKYIYNTLELPEVNADMKTLCEDAVGVYAISENKKTKIVESLFLSNADNILWHSAEYYYISGVLTNKFLLELNERSKSVSLIVRDFSCVFVEPRNYYTFLRRGGKISVLQKPNLIAICTNPVSPDGYNFNAEELRDVVAEVVGVPTYDIFLLG